MTPNKTKRGFCCLQHPTYPNGDERILIQESSIVGDYEDSSNNPGSSALWIGENFHLNREEVVGLIKHLQHWVDHKVIHYNEIKGDGIEING